MDVYNVNLISMCNVLLAFVQMEVLQCIVIMGEMLELGVDSEQEYVVIVEFVLEQFMVFVFLVGKVFEVLVKVVGLLYFFDV